nr:peptidoglycan recognition protein family protein [Armatimonadota bacterium]
LRLFTIQHLIKSHEPEPAPAVAREIDPQGIILHYSDTPSRYGKERVDAAYIDRMHAHDHPRWAVLYKGKVYHIGYHYVILPDGAIERGRPDHCIGAHARHFNNWLGICLVGAFATSCPRDWWPRAPTVEQRKSLIGLCERLMSEYHIPPERIKRHRDVGDTLCPGERFPYALIMEILREYRREHPV